ncbi:MAG: hypothetical protein M3Q63_02700 [bacterium]|nr:hypothetical protein [bacterium]
MKGKIKHPFKIISCILIVIIFFLFLNVVKAVTPNPGHSWIEVGDGTFQVAGPTTLRTYTFPDVNATVLTTNTAVTVGQGGTGAATLTGIVKGNGTSAFTAVTAPSGVLVGDTDTQTLTNKTINKANNTLTDVAGSGVNSDITSLTGLTTALSVAQGGTGDTNLALNNVLLGNGTSGILEVAPGTSGNVLTSNGTTWTSSAPTGGSSASTPNVYNNRQMQIVKNPGAATVTNMGFAAAPTLTATASNADDADGPWLNHATTATNGNASGVISAFTVVRRDWEVEYITTIKTDATNITSVRYWIGLFSALPDTLAAPNIHAVAFRYDTAADGTAFWRAVSIAGTGASATVTATTQSIAANTTYIMRIVCANSLTDCKYYINNTLVATHTTTLPTATQLMGYGNRVTTLSAAIRNLKWGRISIIHD